MPNILAVIYTLGLSPCPVFAYVVQVPCPLLQLNEDIHERSFQFLPSYVEKESPAQFLLGSESLHTRKIWMEKMSTLMKILKGL